VVRVYESVIHEGRIYESRTYESRIYESRMYESRTYESRIYESRTYESRIYESRMYESRICLVTINMYNNQCCKIMVRLLFLARSADLAEQLDRLVI
jgi:hypothetical protein